MTASLTTLDELRAEIEREEMVLADYHARLAACMVEGKDMAPARELVRLAKDRLAVLHERRYLAEAAAGRLQGREGQRP